MTSEDERAGFVWDIALACLALSVKVHFLYLYANLLLIYLKFHRDVLGPYFPVLSEEFLILASHEIGYDDLEVSRMLWDLHGY